jgi:hypothetical protein
LIYQLREKLGYGAVLEVGLVRLFVACALIFWLQARKRIEVGGVLGRLLLGDAVLETLRQQVDRIPEDELEEMKEKVTESWTK